MKLFFQKGFSFLHTWRSDQVLHRSFVSNAVFEYLTEQIMRHILNALKPKECCTTICLSLLRRHFKHLKTDVIFGFCVRVEDFTRRYTSQMKMDKTFFFCCFFLITSLLEIKSETYMDRRER